MIISLPGVLIGAFVGVVAGFIPGVSAIPAVGITQLLFLTPFSQEAIATASVVTYLVASVTGSVKEAYAPSLVATIETSVITEYQVHNPLLLAKKLVWGKIICLTFIPVAFYWVQVSTGYVLSLPSALNLGVGFLILALVKTGTSGIPYACMYGVCFWILKDNMYAAFIIGAGYKIIPMVLINTTPKSKSAKQKENDYKHVDESSQNISVISDPAAYVLTTIYTIFSVGMSPAFLSEFTPRGGANSFVQGIMQTFVMECILLGMFLAGNFTGKSGLGMVTRSELVSFDLLWMVLILLVIWQLVLSSVCCGWWQALSNNKQLIKSGSFFTLSSICCSIVFFGGIAGIACAAICALTPFIFYRLIRRTETSADSVIFTIPMAVN